MILQSEKPMIYPIIDLSIPYIPERSRLYPISPIGLDTPYIESLTSYLCRLATTHNVSFGSFYELLLIPNLNKAYLTTPAHLSPASTLTGSFRNRMNNINGIGKLSQEWRGILEKLTLRSDLRSLSLTALSNVTPHWKLLRTFQAWCPACYEEMLQAKQTIYQPLLWAISVVDICTRHYRPLVDRCSNCHRQLLPLTRQVQLGYCSRCGYWLGERFDAGNIVNAPMNEEEQSWRLFVANSVGELIVALPNMSRLPTKMTAMEALHECIKISTGGVITQFAKLIRKHLMTVYGWYRGKVKIPLPDLIRICYCLDLSIVDFLNGADAVRKIGVNVRELPDVAHVVKSPRNPKSPNYEKFETELTNFLDILPPISFQEAARRIGANHRDLYRRLPELSRKISSKYRDYLKDFYRKQRAVREEEVRQAVIHLYAQGIYVSPRPVAKYLNKPSYIGRRDVAVIIRKTRESLDSERKGWLDGN